MGMLNAYYMLEQLRDGIGEVTAAHWSDANLLGRLNRAHRRAWMELTQEPGDWLLESSLETPVDSVITLTYDQARPAYMERVSDGTPIHFQGTVRERRLTRFDSLSIGTGAPQAYFVGNTIEINQEGFTDQVRLWYLPRVPDLLTGTAATGSGAATIVVAMADRPRLVDDYYNGATIEIVDGTGAEVRTTISDYVGSTQTITTAAGTFGDDSIYGTVSDLPAEAEDMILLRAELDSLAKPSSSVDPEVFKYIQSLFKDANATWNDFIASRVGDSSHVRTTSYWGD